MPLPAKGAIWWIDHQEINKMDEVRQLQEERVETGPIPFNQARQQQQLGAFWSKQMRESEHQALDFKNHNLPLARIKKIMKADEDVRMISAEAPMVFARACEMFIQELTLRSWIHTEENKRRTLQRNDIAAAISRTDVFDFLVDIIPRDEVKEECLGSTKDGGPSYYCVPPLLQHHLPLVVPCSSQKQQQEQQQRSSE